jgi:hypothetical protein
LAIDRSYHRRQAATLVRLAQTTRDQETASALMRLAAEHIDLAEDQKDKTSDPDDAA